MDNLDFAVHTACMSLECGKKPEYSEETHRNMKLKTNVQTPHRNALLDFHDEPQAGLGLFVDRTVLQNSWLGGQRPTGTPSVKYSIYCLS